MADMMESIGLHGEGFTDEQIAQIDAAKDDALHLMATIQQEIPYYEKLVAAEWPRIKRLMPVAVMVLAVLNQRQKEQQQ